MIDEVRGKGMMVGIQLRDQSDSNSHILRMLSQQHHLGYMAAAYMLNVHDIRLAPTLTQPFTLRLEPSAYVPEAELQRACDSIETLCRVIAGRAITHFTGFRFQPAAADVSDYSTQPRAWTVRAAARERIEWRFSAICSCRRTSSR